MEYIDYNNPAHDSLRCLGCGATLGGHVPFRNGTNPTNYVCPQNTPTAGQYFLPPAGFYYYLDPGDSSVGIQIGIVYEWMSGIDKLPCLSCQKTFDVHNNFDCPSPAKSEFNPHPPAKRTLLYRCPTPESGPYFTPPGIFGGNPTPTIAHSGRVSSPRPRRSCECGAWSMGVRDRDFGHSSWCPQRSAVFPKDLLK